MDAEPTLSEGIATTRAIRRYTDEPVPDELVRDLIFAATRAPTGSNRQPVRWIVLRTGPVAEQAKALVAEGARLLWSAKRRTDGYDRGTGQVDDSPKARMAAAMEHYVEHLDRVPLLVLPVLVRYREPTAFEGASVYPACQNLLLAARAQGWGGVLTGFHGLVAAELRELLAVPEGAEIMATITVGRPVGGHGPVRRLPLGEVVFEGPWGTPAPWAVDPPGTRHTSAGPPR